MFPRRKQNIAYNSIKIYQKMVTKVIKIFLYLKFFFMIDNTFDWAEISFISLT